MRVKIADTWFAVTPTTPIMVELSESDRRNIANMAPDATKYASFHADSFPSVGARNDWMDR